MATALAWFSVRYSYEAEALEWGRRAEREAQTALARDADVADAHLALADAAGTLYGGFDWSTLIVRSDRALALDGTLELAYLGRMRAFYHVGLFGPAREAAARARLLNPSPNVEIDRVTVAIELFEGNFAVARDRALELLGRTDAPAVRNYLDWRGITSARWREERKCLRPRSAEASRSQAALASVTAAEDPDQARRILDAVLKSGYVDHHVAYSVGAAYAQLGQQHESLEWLERAATSGFGCWPWFARDPLLEPMRKEPAFSQLLERLRGMASRFPPGS